MATKDLLKPVVHSPTESTEEMKFFNERVDERLSPEIVSCSYIHCVLKGLKNAPIIGNDITRKDIDFLISPYGCFGEPHMHCRDNGIPIIYVKENETILNDGIPYPRIIVENYWEAVGYIKCIDIGINPYSTRFSLTEEAQDARP